MRRFLTLLLCAGLCVQPVLAADAGQEAGRMILQEEMKEEDTDREDTGRENADGEEINGEVTEGEDTEGEETNGEVTDGEENAGEAGGVDVSAPSAILMEASTGQVIHEKDADSKRPPASVTKVMTLLLIFDALEAGKIHLEDEVTTSEYAASMGGSQVFLEPGEVQTVDTMIKCISVASANDACAAYKNGRVQKPKGFFFSCFFSGSIGWKKQDVCLCRKETGEKEQKEMKEIKEMKTEELIKKIKRPIR